MSKEEGHRFIGKILRLYKNQQMGGLKFILEK